MVLALFFFCGTVGGSWFQCCIHIGSRGGDACNLTSILHHGGDGAAGGAEGGSTGCQVAGMVGQVADGCGESVGGCIEHTRDGPCSMNE